MSPTPSSSTSADPVLKDLLDRLERLTNSTGSGDQLVQEVRRKIAEQASELVSRERDAIFRESERRLRSFVEEAPTALAMFDRQMRYICASARWFQDYGLQGRDIRGLSHYDVFPDIPEHWREIHRRALAGEVVAADEEAFRRADGTTQWLRWEVRPHRDSLGNIAGVLIFTEDITARKQTEEILRESEARFRAVADNIPQLAWITDATGKILWFNRRWVEYTGREASPSDEETWRAVHHPDYTESVTYGWKRALETGEHWEDTFPLRRKDGEFRWFLSRAYPIRDSSGKITRWFGTNTDVTQLREAETALKAANEQLQEHALKLESVVAERTARLRETVSELEAFSFSLSHDMRAPLRAMKGFSQILQSEYGERLDDDGNALLKRISAAAGRLDQLIHDVLAYSRVVRDNVKLHAVDLDSLVRQLVDENPALQPPMAIVDIASPLQPVLGHEAYLTQVLSNLLYNAVKFVAPGTRPHVRIRTERTSDSDGEASGRVTLYVQDNGIGIPKDARGRLFGMFQRFHVDAKYEGTGIGLAIVRKAVERMGGTVGVESEPGNGSTFCVQLHAPKAVREIDAGTSDGG